MGQNVVVVMKSKYKEKQDVIQLLRYIAGKGKNECKERVAYIGAKGLPKNPDKAAKRIITLNKLLDKGNGRQVYHLVISFERGTDLDSVRKAACSVASFFSEYYCFYAIHTSTDNLHIHLAFCATNHVTGKKFHLEKNEFNDFKKMVRQRAIEAMG